MKEKHIYIILVIVVMLMLEGPFILMANKIEPMIFGLPFLLFWVLLWWLIATILFLVAFLRNWGNNNP